MQRPGNSRGLPSRKVVKRKRLAIAIADQLMIMMIMMIMLIMMRG